MKTLDEVAMEIWTQAMRDYHAGATEPTDSLRIILARLIRDAKQEGADYAWQSR